MGFHHRDTCHETEASALGAACSAQFPATWRNASGELVADTCAVSGATIVVTSTNTVTAATSTAIASPSFASCDPNEHYADVLALWLLLLVLLAAIAAAKIAGAPIWALWRDT